MTTPEELEANAMVVVALLEGRREHQDAETIRELIVRYRAARITANNYKKALEALEKA